MNLIRTSKPISELINDLKNYEIAIPEIQRDFVWKANRIKKLIDTIQKDYPSGAIILWETTGIDKNLIKSFIRPERRSLFANSNNVPKYLLIDGQQRLTAICSVSFPQNKIKNILGEELNLPNFTLNVKNLNHPEIEEIKNIQKIGKNEILLNELLTDDDEYGINYVLDKIKNRRDINYEHKNNLRKFVRNFNNYSYPVQIINGLNDYRIVSEIFKRVNSQGKPLVTAEIELANILPYWKGFSYKLRLFIEELAKGGLSVGLPFLLNCLASISINKPKIDIFTRKIQNNTLTRRKLNTNWVKTKTAVLRLNKLLVSNLINRSELITTHNCMLPIIYNMVRNRSRNENKNYIKYILYSMITKHYGGNSDTKLNREFNTLKRGTDQFKQILKQLRYSGTKKKIISYRSYKGIASKNPYVLLIYLALRNNKAKDFSSSTENIDISDISSVHLHHIFPYDFMMKDETMIKYSKENKISDETYKAKINDISNLTFISNIVNNQIKNSSPEEYLENYCTFKNMRSHCIPEDKNLWKPQNFEKFMNERRKLLSDSVKKYLIKYSLL